MRGAIAVTVLALAGGGCELVFPPGDPHGVLDECGPSPQDTWRYQRVDVTADPRWQFGRDVCRRIGSDLAVLETPAEVAFAVSVSGLGTRPAWVGLTDEAKEGAWEGVDGCPVDPPWNMVSQPDGGVQENCALVAYDGQPFALFDDVCDLPTAAVQDALCETPTTTDPACGPDASAHVVERYMAMVQAETQELAAATCEDLGAHLVVFDNPNELGFVATHFFGATRYWVGAFDDGAGGWETMTGCPAVFAWAPGEPDASGGCLATIDTDGNSMFDALADEDCAGNAWPFLCEYD